MAEMAVLVDVSRCTGCRGCQVACKQWNKNPATDTCFTGVYENPPDLEWNTFTRVTFAEVEDGGKLAWLFRKDQCRHCVDAPCTMVDGTPMKKLPNGAVVADRSMKITEELFEEVKGMCPYNIPRYDRDSQAITKCTFCNDRQEMGKKPACVSACLSGALFYGTREEVIAEGEKRLAALKGAGYGKAALVEKDEVSWIYLFTHPAKQYGMFFDPTKRQRVALG
jgi:formate dehydrogenase iron-sulfur subunit